MNKIIDKNNLPSTCYIPPNAYIYIRFPPPMHRLLFLPLLLVCTSLFAQYNDTVQPIEPPLVKWAAAVGGDYGASISTMTTDTSGNVYIGGSFDRLLFIHDTLMPGSAKIINPIPGNTPYLASLDTNGHMRWLLEGKRDDPGNNWTSSIHKMVVGDSGYVYVLGSTSYETIWNKYQIKEDTSFFFYLLKINAADGNVVWGKALPGISSSFIIKDIKLTEEYIYLAGNSVKKSWCDFAGKKTYCNGVAWFQIAYDGKPIDVTTINIDNYKNISYLGLFNIDNKGSIYITIAIVDDSTNNYKKKILKINNDSIFLLNRGMLYSLFKINNSEIVYNYSLQDYDNWYFDKIPFNGATPTSFEIINDSLIYMTSFIFGKFLYFGKELGKINLNYPKTNINHSNFLGSYFIYKKYNYQYSTEFYNPIGLIHSPNIFNQVSYWIGAWEPLNQPEYLGPMRRDSLTNLHKIYLSKFTLDGYFLWQKTFVKGNSPSVTYTSANSNRYTCTLADYNGGWDPILQLDTLRYQTNLLGVTTHLIVQFGDDGYRPPKPPVTPPVTAFALWPNPGNDQIQVQVPAGETVLEIALYATDGRQVFYSNTYTSPVLLPAHLAAGCYAVRVRSNQQTYSTLWVKTQ